MPDLASWQSDPMRHGAGESVIRRKKTHNDAQRCLTRAPCPAMSDAVGGASMVRFSCQTHVCGRLGHGACGKAVQLSAGNRAANCETSAEIGNSAGRLAARTVDRTHS